jgi:hypothetical protein
MIAMIAATSISAVNPCGNAAALEVTDASADQVITG